MGSGRLVVDLALKVAIVAGYAGLYELTPLRLHPSDWWFWPLLFVADDFAYYWYHRIHHVCRVFWATHVVHHSSQHYNLSTALRQPWISISTFPFWMWLPLVGFPVWTVLLARAGTSSTSSGSTPSGSCAAALVRGRLQHAQPPPGAPRLQPQYLDRNYGGDPDHLGPAVRHLRARRRPGALRADQEHRTFNPLRVNFHEYLAIWHDLEKPGAGAIASGCCSAGRDGGRPRRPGCRSRPGADRRTGHAPVWPFYWSTQRRGPRPNLWGRGGSEGPGQVPHRPSRTPAGTAAHDRLGRGDGRRRAHASGADRLRQSRGRGPDRLSRAELLGENPRVLQSEDTDPAARAQMRAAITPGCPRR